MSLTTMQNGILVLLKHLQAYDLEEQSDAVLICVLSNVTSYPVVIQAATVPCHFIVRLQLCFYPERESGDQRPCDSFHFHGVGTECSFHPSSFGAQFPC
jgi:hypothetical protein